MGVGRKESEDGAHDAGHVGGHGARACIDFFLDSSSSLYSQSEIRFSRHFNGLHWRGTLFQKRQQAPTSCQVIAAWPWQPVNMMPEWDSTHSPTAPTARCGSDLFPGPDQPGGRVLLAWDYPMN